jgi:long-chain acyl-CoA synthetase
MFDRPSFAAAANPVTLVTRDVRSLGAMFLDRVRRSGERPAMWEKVGGRWDAMSWNGFRDAAFAVAGGLMGLGVAVGDRVGIVGDTRRQWAVLDIGGQLAGAVTFGIYPRQSVEQVRFLLQHSGCRVVFVESAHELKTVLEAAQGLEQLEAIVPWSSQLHASFAGRDPRLVDPASLAKAAAAAEVEARLDVLKPDDTAILVYTSGTTGPPKAAMLTHAAIIDLLWTQSSMLAFREDDVSLSFLPMAHVAERILAFYGRIVTGIATYYASSTARVLDELKEVRPTVFGSVPRIFEKAYDRVMGEVAKAPRWKRVLFEEALKAGVAVIRREHAGRAVPLALKVRHKVLDRLVFQRVRDAFGGRVRLFVTGAAPIATPILEFFWAAGLPVYEAYGMTEATVATHINRPGAVRLGTVGRVVPPMECRIAEDGEVLLRGPWVFKGYFDNPEATAEALQNGWLHTGDIGSVDAEGFLRITDRKKHLIITAGGKNLSPANIEKAIREASPLIAHAHAHGDRRPYVSAIVAPSPLETLAFGREQGVVTSDEEKALTAELMDHPTGRSAALEAAMARVVALPPFQDEVRRAVAKANQGLAHVEQVRRFVLLGRDFSQERGEITPTMKLRRKAIEALHESELDRLYRDPGAGLEPG